MAVFESSKPPALPSHADYTLYKDWLMHNFYQNLCSYCLLQHVSLQIDHYIPVAFVPERNQDPTNLLLACERCNCSKSDYHPLFSGRRTRKNDTHGFNVLDIRVDNFAGLFKITADGQLLPKTGPEYERAIWNVLLLKLDVSFVNEKRAECLRFLNACEGLISKKGKDAEQYLNMLIPFCAQRYLFFRAFDIPVSPELASHLHQYIETRRPILVT